MMSRCRIRTALCALALGALWPSLGQAQYDGVWTGTTGQAKSIEFTVSNNRITSVEISGRVTGAGCTADFTITVAGLNQLISNGSFSVVSNTSAPGGASFTFNGNFSSSTSASGSLSFSLNSIPGVPTCPGSGSTTWTASKQGGGGTTPSISINDVTVIEGDQGMKNVVFQVNLSAASSQPVMIDYTTSDGTASAGSDYIPKSGVLTFNPGETGKGIVVEVLGDTEQENNETFFVDLSNPTNATLADDRGRGTIQDDDSNSGGGCVSNDTTLCLNNDRFSVRANWRTAQGQTGAGHAVELTPDTGYFWFFNSSNVEMVLKLLRACGSSGHFWVFAGGLTNVEVEIVVTDTQSGQVKTYQNPLNQPFQPIQDTQAFATCP